MPDVDLQPEQWQIVQHILQKHVPGHAVWAFGSRVKGTAKPYSDLDLAIITDTPLPYPYMPLWLMTFLFPIYPGK